MKKTIFLSLLAFVLSLCLPAPRQKSEQTSPGNLSAPLHAVSEAVHNEEALPPCPVRLPDTLSIQHGDALVKLSLEDYLFGVLAAEMPASFPGEALKAQAVAARSYAVSNAAGKHSAAAVCSDPGCCQAWKSDDELRTRWGENYEANAQKIRAAVEATRSQILCYEDAPIFAAFHSSSAGRTEDCGAIWNARPYLVSVPSPETVADVPNYISTVSCWPIDFRDTLLSSYPSADFSGAEDAWIGETQLDASGRVAEIVLGGAPVPGTVLRQLFSLRSTAFSLAYEDGLFVFTVTGYGHGVGMSQYGAKVMAEQGASYREILAHYYPGALLVCDAGVKQNS